MRNQDEPMRIFEHYKPTRSTTFAAALCVMFMSTSHSAAEEADPAATPTLQPVPVSKVPGLRPTAGGPVIGGSVKPPVLSVPAATDEETSSEDESGAEAEDEDAEEVLDAGPGSSTLGGSSETGACTGAASRVS